MPLLAQLLSGLFLLLFKFLVQIFSIERAFKLAAMLSMIALATALWYVQETCAKGVCAAAINSISTSHQSFAVGLSLAFNQTTYSSVACYLTVWSACQIYIIKKRMITMAG